MLRLLAVLVRDRRRSRCSLPASRRPGPSRSRARRSSTTATPASTRSPGFDTGDSIRFTRFGGDAPRRRAPVQREPGQPERRLPEGRRRQLGAPRPRQRRRRRRRQRERHRCPSSSTAGPGTTACSAGAGSTSSTGGSGDDNVISRDGRAEQVDCGAGTDTAISDDGDARSSCEEIEGDADGDGVRRPADCNDTNPGIRPGAADTPDDRVDQDCSGTDATNLDVDGDGSPRPQDCNDANPAIRPGARERAGNGVDENCDTRIVPFPAISGLVGNLWRGVRRAHGQREAHRQGLPEGHDDRAALHRPGLPLPARSRGASRAAAAP